MERKFEITMHAPLGKRHGSMRFTEKDGNISGMLELLGGKDSFKGTVAENGTIKFSGEITSRLHSFAYLAMGTITGSDMKLNVTGDRYSFRITGEEIISQEETTK